MHDLSQDTDSTIPVGECANASIMEAAVKGDIECYRRVQLCNQVFTTGASTYKVLSKRKFAKIPDALSRRTIQSEEISMSTRAET